MKKDLIIKKILNDPQTATREEIDFLIWPNQDNEDNLINREDLRDVFLKVYDLNETAELGQADADFMGWLNRSSNNKRNKHFYKRLKKNINCKKIYAEGDSWFQHPLIKDLIDKIDKITKKKFAIYSSAMGGEWWINIIEKGDYLPEISKIKPEVILLSGAGNDLVGGRKLSNIVNPKEGYLADDFKDLNKDNFYDKIKSHPYLSRIIKISDEQLTDEQKDFFIYGIKVLSKEFFSLMWAFELMYKYVIRNIQKKHTSAKIITQGYDYPIPSYKKSFRPTRIICSLGGMKNGHWLADALNLAGIEQENQRKVTFTLIYIFNKILISLTEEARFKGNLYHIDARNATEGKRKNWYDEMHVKPKIFEKIAKAYIKCIDNESSASEKVIKV